MKFSVDDSESYYNSTGRAQNSIQFSGSGRRRRTYSRERFLSSVKTIRNVSNQSIRDIPENDRINSTTVAGYNVTNLIQGIGILGIPYSLVIGSWIGALMILVISFIACSTGKMLIECLYDNNEITGRTRVRKSYSCIGKAVWPKFGKLLLTVFTFIEMFGGTTLYIILMSVESQKLISPILPDFSIYYCSLILTCLSLPLTFVTRMSIVSWFSFIAVIGLLGSIVTIIVFCFYNITKISVTNFPQLHWDKVPLSLGIITFSYCAHAAFPGIETCMKKPSSFNTMMDVSFSAAAIVKLSMAFLFVMIFGMNTYQQCSLNVDNIYFSHTLEVLIIVNVFFSIPLTIFILTEQLDDTLQHHFHHSLWPGGHLYWCWLLLSRSLILTACLFSAMMVPHFGLLMGLIGSVTGSCLMFIFPCVFSLVLQKDQLTRLEKSYRVFVVLLGVLFGVSGTVVSLKEIIETPT